MNDSCRTGSKGLVICAKSLDFFYPLPPELFPVSPTRSAPRIVPSDLLSGAGVETASPLAPACRRSPAQPVITLAVTFSPSPSTPLPPTPTVRPVRSPRSLAQVRPFPQFCRSGWRKNKVGGRSCKLHCRSCVQANAATPPQSKQDVAPVEWELAAASAGGERPQSFDQLGEIVRAAVLLFCCFPPPHSESICRGEEEQITHLTLPQVA